MLLELIDLCLLHIEMGLLCTMGGQDTIMAPHSACIDEACSLKLDPRSAYGVTSRTLISGSSYIALLSSLGALDAGLV